MPGHFTFYTDKIQNDHAYFEEQEYRHAIIALRYQKGNEIGFTDGLGNLYTGVIDSIGKRDFVVKVTNKNYRERRSGLHLVVGVIKSSDRMEWMVEKCTELGVKTISFVETDNSERSKINPDRLSKVAIAALKQSHGCWLPEIRTLNWKSVLSLNMANKYIALIQGENTPSWGAIASSSHDVCMLVGPEGDFTPAEIQAVIQAGFQPVKLGDLVLRTETACMAAAAVYAMTVH